MGFESTIFRFQSLCSLFQICALNVESWHEWCDRFVCSFYVLQCEIYLTYNGSCTMQYVIPGRRTTLSTSFTLLKVCQECSHSHVLYICDKCENTTNKWKLSFLLPNEKFFQRTITKTKWIQNTAKEKSNDREDEYKVKWRLYFLLSQRKIITNMKVNANDSQAHDRKEMKTVYNNSESVRCYE